MFQFTSDYRILSELGSPNAEILGDGFFDWFSEPQALSSLSVEPKTIAAARRELEGLWFRLPELAALYQLAIDDPDYVAMTIAKEALVKKLSLRDLVSTLAIMSHSARVGVFLGDRELLASKVPSKGFLGRVSPFRGTPTMQEQVAEYGQSMLKRSAKPSEQRLREAKSFVQSMQLSLPLDALTAVLTIPPGSLVQAIARESERTGSSATDIITSVVLAVPPLWNFLSR